MWYSKLSATAQIMPELNLTGGSEDLIIDEATRRFNLIRDSLFMSVEEEMISIQQTDSIKKSSSAILTLIQSAQDKLDRFFTMSKIRSSKLATKLFSNNNLKRFVQSHIFLGSGTFYNFDITKFSKF